MLHCFQCGRDMPDNLAYCVNCGARLDDETETVVHPEPAPLPPVMPQAKQGSGALKFILGSLLGALAVLLLLVIGGFVLFSMKKDGDTSTNRPDISININADSPTPHTSPTPRKPTATQSPSSVNVNGDAVAEGKICTVINPAGGSVNLRGYCDVKNCTEDAETIYLQADPGEKVELTKKKPVKTGRFTWVQVKYNGDVAWISASKIDCD